MFFLNLKKTQLHFTSDFLQKITINRRIILQISRSTRNVFDAVRKIRRICVIMFKTLGCSFLNITRAIKTYLLQCARQSFYKSLIQPIVDYTCVFWGAASQYNLDRMLDYRNTRKALLISRDVPLSELFYKINWMTINQRIFFYYSDRYTHYLQY